MGPPPVPAEIAAVERPCPELLTYYVLKAIATLFAAPVTMLLLYFRYHTMRYRFDAEGIHMRWGILMRHEIMLNYSRIQDIQLRSNVVERWLGHRACVARVIIPIRHSKLRRAIRSLEFSPKSPASCGRSAKRWSPAMSEFSAIERWVLRVLRVPPAPEPPEGSPDSIQIFHAGRNLYIWCLLQWFLFHVAILLFLTILHRFTALASASWPE